VSVDDAVTGFRKVDLFSDGLADGIDDELDSRVAHGQDKVAVVGVTAWNEWHEAVLALKIVVLVSKAFFKVSFFLGFLVFLFLSFLLFLLLTLLFLLFLLLIFFLIFFLLLSFFFIFRVTVCWTFTCVELHFTVL